MQIPPFLAIFAKSISIFLYVNLHIEKIEMFFKRSPIYKKNLQNTEITTHLLS